MRVDRLYFDLFSSYSSHFKLAIISFWSQSLNLTGTLLDSCAGCKRVRMAAVPQGMFAAGKVRANMNRAKTWPEQDLAVGMEKLSFSSKQQGSSPMVNYQSLETPMKYNSKLMNSIWGLYNRYSVHNFKKNTDGKSVFAGEHHLTAVSSPSFKDFFLANNKN